MGHGEAGGSKEVTAEAVEVSSDYLDTEGASTAGGRYSRSKHRWKEVIGETEKGAAAAEDAIFADAVSVKCVITLSELCVDVVRAVPLNVGRLVDFCR